MTDMLTHQPYLGFAVDDLAVRAIAGELRFNWWYGEVVKKGSVKLSCDPADLAIEYAELIDELMESWEPWKCGVMPDSDFTETLRSSVVKVEKWLDSAPRAPWLNADKKE
ncbi:hypothetical protein [Kitasatospora sp. GP82]|uniref:hypothetical protein n=1 Tax=Kitasatospora sp. GP82 TaxID=3035089 RepID=UPI002473F936|nr:hypothetical protein [Kitasatospora sp. GP82]MDH6127433.1 hypothetical protein [Kitasatospora sp. GP82]